MRQKTRRERMLLARRRRSEEIEKHDDIIKKKKKKVKPTYTHRFLRVFSRHPSHKNIRKKNNGLLCEELAIVRFGSTTPSKKKIQINSIEAVKNSSSKIRMKRCFAAFGVQTPHFWETVHRLENALREETTTYPILAKLIFGSRGNGMVKIDNDEQLQIFIMSNRFRRDPERYYFEKFHNFSKEYRIHVSKFGCFYTNRKMLREDIPENQRWFRNNENSVWFLENNPGFDKPETWDLIIEDCVNALRAVGLDVGACDVRVSTKGTHKVIEINSAPSFGEGTEAEYRKILTKLVADKKRTNL